MERKSRSIDGFIPVSGRTVKAKKFAPPVLKPRSSAAPLSRSTSSPVKSSVVDQKARALKKELDDSLQSISTDFTDLEKPKQSETKTRKLEKLQKKLNKKNVKRAKKGKKALTLKQFKHRRLTKRIIWLVLIVLLVLAGWKIKGLLDSMDNLFQGNIFEIGQKTRLKEDENHRTNVLVFGTAEEDWDGADLTDSVMIVSLNQDDHSVYTVSLPRDLYVKHTCRNLLGTTAGKLNESYVCGREDHSANQDGGEAAGAAELAKTAGLVTGLDIHYTAHINWNVVVQVVDNLGGVDLEIEVYDGSPEMYDYATKVRYKNGEKVHLDGESALALSRARGSEGGYGLSGGNFDRERNQQKILQAVAQKVNTDKTDPFTLISMLDALGDNVHADFRTSEIRTLADLSKDFNAQNIISIPLVDHDKGVELLRTDSINGISVVLPTAGIYDYSEVEKYIRLQIFAEPWEREQALIDVLNGSGIVGFAASKADLLESEGFQIGTLANAPAVEIWPTVTIYRFNDHKPETEKKLKEKYGVEVSPVPANIITSDAADFVIIFGQ